MIPDRVRTSPEKLAQFKEQHAQELQAAMPMQDFWNYRAILDLDGNSWSERFPRVLCGNSVVIKVSPAQVDYFWPTLFPHVHYVPANLTNLTAVAAHVVADDNQVEMQQIVANAQSWCQNHLVRS